MKDWSVKELQDWDDKICKIAKEKYNLENHSMKEIVDSELFAKKLPDTWKNPDTAPGPCQRYCKVK